MPEFKSRFSWYTLATLLDPETVAFAGAAVSAYALSVFQSIKYLCTPTRHWRTYYTLEPALEYREFRPAENQPSAIFKYLPDVRKLGRQMALKSDNIARKKEHLVQMCQQKIVTEQHWETKPEWVNPRLGKLVVAKYLFGSIIAIIISTWVIYKIQQNLNDSTHYRIMKPETADLKEDMRPDRMHHADIKYDNPKISRVEVTYHKSWGPMSVAPDKQWPIFSHKGESFKISSEISSHYGSYQMLSDPAVVTHLNLKRDVKRIGSVNIERLEMEQDNILSHTARVVTARKIANAQLHQVPEDIPLN